jgi:Uma2 family endonuclease
VVLEQSSPIKHEFFDGEIFAMAGGTPDHSALAVAVATELKNQLRGTPCRVYNSDLRVRVATTGLGTYPDVSVFCGETEKDPQDANTLTNPTVLVEVLSESTEEYDRGEKFENYRQISSLKSYVLVSTRERLVEVFSRGPQGEWVRTEGRRMASVELPSIQCTLRVDAIYEGVSAQL